jgi:hypothetical protein
LRFLERFFLSSFLRFCSHIKHTHPNVWVPSGVQPRCECCPCRLPYIMQLPVPTSPTSSTLHNVLKASVL